MNYEPNTRIQKGDIQYFECKKIIEIYRSLGFNTSAMRDNEPYYEWMANTINQKLTNIPFSVEFRPDGLTENKLDFITMLFENKHYVHVQARPNSVTNCKEAKDITEKFDKAIRLKFIE